MLSLAFAIAFAILGAVTGSFAGVVSERLFTGQSWLSGRSRCNSCGRFLTAYDLVPVVSWVVSLGRCRTCGSRITALYAVSEAVLGLLFALAYLRLGISILLALFLVELVILAIVVLYDIRHTVVPAFGSTLLVIIAALYAALATQSAPLIGYVFLIAGCIALGFFLLYVCSSGRAMGLGDAPVALALALLVGPSAIAGLLFSFWIGALFGITILVLRPGGPTMGIEVPFVPFLAAGFLLAYFTGWNPLPFALF